MKRLYYLLLMVGLSTVLQARPDLVPGERYKFVSRAYPSGGISIGAPHGASTPLYYFNGTSDDQYWILQTGTKASCYTLCNAVSGQYITYTGLRDDNHRYVELTDAPNGTSSEWTIVQNDGYYNLQRADAAGEVMNVRSGSYMVGTYNSNGGSSNEQFTILDAYGNTVGEKVKGSGPGQYFDLTLNDKSPVYDKYNSALLHTIPEECMNGNDYVAYVQFAPTEPEYADYYLYIDGVAVSSGSDFTFSQVEGNKYYPVSVVGPYGVVYETYITFTSLPIVEINGTFNSNYSYGTIRVNQWFTTGIDSLHTAKLKWRGATAQGKPKKSYAIKLVDQNYEPKDASFLGLRSDNNWILDAAYIDRSRARNRVSTDLWNDYAAKPHYQNEEPKAINGTRGQFVEVLLNGSYNGIYCMTEKVDRKQLKLKKYSADKEDNKRVRGCLYKSSQWSYSVLMGHEIGSTTLPKNSPPAYSNRSMAWDNWELKYPDLEDNEEIDWGPLWEAINFVATSNNYNFKRYVDKYFDMPVVRDYYLLMELSFATDNHGKNLYWHCYNRNKAEVNARGDSMVRMCLTPWDFDGSWGRRWDGGSSITQADQDWITFLWAHEHGELTLYKRLRDTDYQSWNDSLAMRYALLRKGAFHTDSLKARFNHYREQFNVSGADRRETNRWATTGKESLNFEDEKKFLSIWIEQRLAFMDQQYDIANIETAVQERTLHARFRVTGGQGRMLIESGSARTCTLYDVSGKVVRTLSVSEGFTEVNGLARGLYLIEGQKVMIR